MTQIGTGALTPQTPAPGIAQPLAVTRSRHHHTSWHTSTAAVAGLVLALIIAADYLFYGQAIGWTLGLFGLLAAAAILIRRPGVLRSPMGVVTALAFLGCCIMLVIQPGPLRIILAIIGLLTLAALSARKWTSHVSAWLTRWTELLVRCVIQVPLDVATRIKWGRAHDRTAGVPARHVAAWIVPVLLSLVFLGLFAAANPVISKWMGHVTTNVSDFFVNLGEYVPFTRVLLWILVGISAWGLLRGRLWTRDIRMLAEAGGEAALARVIKEGLLVRCLVAFNVVFLLQNTLDLVTIASNGATLPEGMDFRTYARRGAYPLVATALLAGAFVLLTFRSGHAQSAAPQSAAWRWSRRLVYLWIGQNILLALSAIWRLYMYVEAFGLTRLRVSAAVWMLLVAVGLALVIWRIAAHRSNAWLVRANAISLAVVLYGCAWMNWDSLIARFDVNKCYELGGPGPRIDLRYMRSLGVEAIPTLRLLEQHSIDPRVALEAGGTAAGMEHGLRRDLQTWRGWTLRRAQIAAQLPEQ